MMSVVLVKDGVLFTKIAPGGFRILAAIDGTAEFTNENLIITSACDGEHSGPDDPHHRGEAYDIRTHNLKDKQFTLDVIKSHLDPDHFYAFLEAPNTDNEHIHVQVKKGTTFPPIQVHLDANDL